MAENDANGTCTRAGVGLDGSIGPAPECGDLVLVVGDAPAPVHRRISRTLLDGPLPSYRRILALPTLRPDDVDAHLPPSTRRDRSHLQLVEFGDRDGSTENRHDTPDPRIRAGSIRRVEPDLGAVGVAVSELVSSGELGAGELAPCELQVCIDGFEVLADGAPDEFTVVKFAHLLQSRLEKADGVGYVHLRRPASSPLVTQLAPVVASRVDLRGTAERPEYRVVQSDGTGMEWTTLEPGPDGRAP